MNNFNGNARLVDFKVRHFFSLLYEDLTYPSFRAMTLKVGSHFPRQLRSVLLL